MTAPSDIIENRNNRRELTDEHYVALVRNGDTDAFRKLVERHQKKMLNIAYRMTGDYEEACEVVQEAFLSAFKASTKFRGDAQFSTWLTSITINHARSRIRQITSRFLREGSSTDDPLDTDTGRVIREPPSGDASPEERLAQKEIQQKVQDCIGSLDTEFREVLVLRDIRGFSYDEIHVILNLPDGTMKSRLFRARESVKNCLKKAFGDL